MVNVLKNTLRILDRILYSFRSSSVPKEKHLLVDYISAEQGNCGIACAVMLIGYLGGSIEISDSNFDNLKTNENYLEPIGWRHQGLKKIIEQHSGKQVEIFRYKSVDFVINQLSKNLPVIVSITVPNADNLDGKDLYKPINSAIKSEKHMVVCVGYDSNSMTCHDPRNIGVYSKDLRIPKFIFGRIFNGNGIIPVYNHNS